MQQPPALPRALLAERLATSPEVNAHEARAVASDSARPAGARYVALRRLERERRSGAVEAACALVDERAQGSQEDRQLAVNSLGTLARLPGGARALERYAERGPTAEVRRAARVLLARRGG